MGVVLGALLFALCLLLSIAWHECGHMWAAQRTGMVVRRYFVGFGPTVWSTKRNGTEYGVKAIPLGGFCDIAGMTSYDDIAPEHASRAMFRQKAWKRLVVLAAGPAQNFILGFVIIVILAFSWGLPNINPGPQPATVHATGCVTSSIGADGSSAPCTGGGPAAAAGLRSGDTIVAVNGASVSTYPDASKAIQKASGPVALTVRNSGVERGVTITPQTVQVAAHGDKAATTISRVGIEFATPPAVNKYSAGEALGGSVAFTGDLAHATWNALITLPTKIHALWTSVTGGERSQDTPISVYGASVLGGQAADHGQWPTFVLLLISINFFLGLFNLVPLLPLDGGHMAIVGYEKARNFVRRLAGKPAGGPVDYLKLMPATYAVLVVMGGYMVLTLTADILNPIKFF